MGVDVTIITAYGFLVNCNEIGNSELINQLYETEEIYSDGYHSDYAYFVVVPRTVTRLLSQKCGGRLGIGAEISSTLAVPEPTEPELARLHQIMELINSKQPISQEMPMPKLGPYIFTYFN